MNKLKLLALISITILIVFFVNFSYSREILPDGGGVCGNGVVDAGEECDGANLNGQTCQSLGYAGGTLSCFGDCSYYVNNCFFASAVCGNGVIEGTEQCDGTNFGGWTCGSYGYYSGSLSCINNCATISTASCSGFCQDGVVNGAEQCDGNTRSCGNCGTESCTASCTWSGSCTGQGVCSPGTVQYQSCGNCGSQSSTCTSSCGWGTWGTCSGTGVCSPGTVQYQSCGNCGSQSSTCTSSCGWGLWGSCTGEGCAPGSTASCSDILPGYGGTATCASYCDYDTSTCVTCNNNNRIDPDEMCDGTDLGGLTCQNMGYASGTLSCFGCQLDTSGCKSVVCGDGLIEGTEQCDGTNFAGKTCSTYGYYSGSLSCINNCATISTSGCSGYCGDGTINGPEQCEGTSTTSCQSLNPNYAPGTITCSGCRWPTSSCTFCGNGVCDISIGENFNNCATDCLNYCGDGVCAGTNTRVNCYTDCYNVGGPCTNGGNGQTWWGNCDASGNPTAYSAPCFHLSCQTSGSTTGCSSWANLKEDGTPTAAAAWTAAGSSGANSWSRSARPAGCGLDTLISGTGDPSNVQMYTNDNTYNTKFCPANTLSTSHTTPPIDSQFSYTIFGGGSGTVAYTVLCSQDIIEPIEYDPCPTNFDLGIACASIGLQCGTTCTDWVGSSCSNVYPSDPTSYKCIQCNSGYSWDQTTGTCIRVCGDVKGYCSSGNCCNYPFQPLKYFCNPDPCQTCAGEGQYANSNDNPPFLCCSGLSPDANGVCKWNDGQPCSLSSQCLSNSCVLVYQDADGDGYGNPAVSTTVCTGKTGYVSNNQDCNDGNFNVKPGVAETCNDNQDNNCNSQTDCQEASCAGQLNYAGATCCQSAANCLGDNWYCNANTREFRDYSCISNICTHSVSSSEDCSTKASIDSDGSATAYTLFGIVIDFVGCSGGACTSNDYPDSCSAATLTEYGASGASYASSSYNCDSYDTNSCWCLAAGSILSRLCDDWNCGSGQCRDSGADYTQSSQTCSAANQCGASASPCNGYRCYMANAGSWNWGISAEASETNCNDNYDNDCDGYVDEADSNCAITLVLTPNPVAPSGTVTASLSSTYPSGTVTIRDYLGCSSPNPPVCIFTYPTSSCTFTAPSNSAYTYGYYACIGQNSDAETLTVTGSHCSASPAHSTGDDSSPSTYRHYLTTSWFVENCNNYDDDYCRLQCNAGTGDIDNVCDDYQCSGGSSAGGCFDSGSDWTMTSRVQDCSDTCTGATSVSYQTTDADLTDYELCSAGQASCPSAQVHDSCSGGSTLTEYYCSGADAVSSTQDCNFYDGWYCNGNVREYREYGCSDPGTSGAYCSYTVSSSEDCSTKLSTDSDGSSIAYTLAGTVTDYASCSPAVCISNSYSDSCSANTLTEYGASAATFTSGIKNCEEYEIFYCLSDRYYKQEWGCSGNPSFCNDAAVADISAGINADGDAKDKECGDSLCDNAAGVYDSTKTATETNCADSADDDCDGLTDCADPDCAGQTGPGGGATCCQAATSCLQDDCVIESCQGNTCTYSNLRPQCDSTECAAGSYCNAAGGDCKAPDADNSVCVNCATDTTSGLPWTWTPANHQDAGKAYSTSLFNSDAGLCTPASGGACFDATGALVNHKSALTTGNCCGNNPNEFYKPDYYGGECTNNVDDCIWSTGDAQASNTGNAEWWCNQHEWYQCTSSNVGQRIGSVTCAGTSSGNPTDNNWVPTNGADPPDSGPLQPENQYSCTDGLDNDGDGAIDCQDSDCFGSIIGTVTDQNSQPVSLATIDAKSGLTTVASATTSQSGTYSIASLSCGNLNIAASHSAYVPQTKSINLLPNQQAVADFSLASGTSCEQDCTYVNDNIVHDSCDGKNGCGFYDAVAKAACDNAQPGWVRDYDANNYVRCASGSPQPKVEIVASVTCSSGTLVKITRIVLYNGKPVKLVVATCG